ncbi:MAG: iron-sulfur cluster-binding protein [Burkholderiaceae bacterium]|nr:iron-sulfur cluster-binding protein [Burkholderiaceae bacterium]
MQVQSMHFKERAGMKLADVRLQKNLKKLAEKFVTARASAIAELDDFEATRTAAVERRNRVLANLDGWLQTFERNAAARGATVLYAETREEAARLIVEIATLHGVRKVTKSKSMVSEEIELNHAFEAAGMQPVETDLGEYILQINNNEAPSHIIAPVIHKDKEEISDLFARAHQKPRKTEITQLTREAREVLRSHFLSADMGVTGANFLIAETGSAAVVTNEGNEGMCTIMPPRVHVVLTGIEKVLPTLEDLSTLMRLLPRSATGQQISNYFSILTGPRRAAELDGPEHMYYVLLDGGRSELIGGEYHEMLRCIRCGACMNHCPVYQKIGGHAYGWVYPGPMGSVLTPNYVGIQNAIDLPQAATFCNQCSVVCPVKIPLPDLMRKLRERQWQGGLRPWYEKVSMKIWAYVAKRPIVYGLAAKTAVRLLHRMGGRDRRIRSLPLGGGWTTSRDFPAPSGRTFRELYRERQSASQPGTRT